MDKIKLAFHKNNNIHSLKSIDGMTKSKQHILSEIFRIIESDIIYADKLMNDLEIKDKVEKLIRLKTGNTDNNEQNIIRHNVIEKYGSELPDLVKKMNIPHSIASLFPAALERLYSHLKAIENIGYDSNDDFYLKDICFVLGKSVPGGAQVLEVNSYIPVWRSLSSSLRPTNLFSIIKYMKIIRPGHWLRIHTEARYLADFNEQGWDRCYCRIGELLSRKPHCKGMVGTSWFYDPALITISPNLSYLQKRPLENGAIRIRHRTSQLDTERATLKSKTRRKLYQKGRYTPACYSIFWHRNELIEWSKRNHDIHNET